MAGPAVDANGMLGRIRRAEDVKFRIAKFLVEAGLPVIYLGIDGNNPTLSRIVQRNQTMNNRRAAASLVAGLSVVVAGAWAMSDDDKPSQASIMERKLEHAQGILSALAREDFESLGSNADALLKLSEEEWTSRDTPEYRAQLKDFWTVLEGIKSSADDKNLDGATLAYVQMTVSCVRCHKHLRENPE